MTLLELKELVDEWVATGDWDDYEVAIFSDRMALHDKPIGFEVWGPGKVIRFVTD